MNQMKEKYQVAVVGGGLAGLCAAIAAARSGMKTCLIQNRPVLGGNSSSEIRVTPHGAAAFHAYARETGIISELLIEERATNHEEIFENGWTNSVWDMVQYDMVQRTEGLTLYLNTDYRQVEMANNRHIRAIKAYVQNAETELTIEAEQFIDCTGDGAVAYDAGCEFRIGSESRDEFGEPHAPIEKGKDIMGSSLHFKTRKMDRPVPFKAPEWAVHYDNPDFFYQNGRPPKDARGGYWWLEIGVPYDTIHQNEIIRHELTRHLLGVWDWMKNRDPQIKEQMQNYALDWVGQVPGKRESRRIMGLYLMQENDIHSGRVFEDEIAFGGWFIDLHTPGGLLACHSEPASGENYDTFTDYAVKSYAGPYGIPLRCLVAKDIDNLLMAGRDISVTHAVLGSSRVMGTGALLGQAAGTAAALAIGRGKTVSDFSPEDVHTVQQRLLRDGCFLPNYKNEDPDDLARKATLSASSEALEYGAGPDSIGYHRGLSCWKDQPQYCDQVLHNAHGQFIAVGNDRIDRISVCITNRSTHEEVMTARIMAVTGIFDYRIENLPVLYEGIVSVPVGEKRWVNIDVNLCNLKKGRFIRLDIAPNPKLEWLLAGRIISGHIATYQIAPDKMRRFGNGHTLSFRTSPAQACYTAANVTNGVTRPAGYTNLWKSDPAQPLPQSISLQWKQEISVMQVELTFPGHLLRELHAYKPFYHDPQCPRDYTIEALINGIWKPLATINDNYQRHRIHRFSEPASTKHLRVTVTATNGDPSAQIYEIRCYRN